MRDRIDALRLSGADATGDVPKLLEDLDALDTLHREELAAEREATEQWRATAKTHARALYGQKSERRTGPPREGKSRNAKGSEEAQSAAPPTNADAHESESKRTSKGRKAADRSKIQSKKTIEFKFTGDKCPCGCGGAFVSMGFETTTKTNFVPSKLEIFEERTETIRCLTTGAVISIKSPYRFTRDREYTEDFAAMTAIHRFVDFMPWYRIESMLHRMGQKISRGQLARLADHGANMIQCVVDEIGRQLDATKVVAADETIAPIIEGGDGKVRHSHIVAKLRNPSRYDGGAEPAVLFLGPSGRSIRELQAAIGEIEDWLISDGYKAWLRIAKPGRHQTCWAHVRRKFEKAVKQGKSTKSAIFLDLIGKLFAIEREINGMTPSQRLAIRQEKSEPVIRQIKEAAETFKNVVSKKTLTGKAINYMVGLWDTLINFVKDGELEVDNNLIENAIRYIVMLRKNIMFCATERGAAVWANFATVIVTAILNGKNPEKYLRWVFYRIGNRHPLARMHELLPWNFDESTLVPDSMQQALAPRQAKIYPPPDGRVHPIYVEGRLIDAAA